MSAPERIYAGPDAVLGWDYITAEHAPWPDMGYVTEYTRTDLIQPMIAAAVAARLEEAAGVVWDRADTIRSLIRPDEADALAEVRRQARVEGMLADVARGPMVGELMEPWIKRMMERAAALIEREGGE